MSHTVKIKHIYSGKQYVEGTNKKVLLVMYLRGTFPVPFKNASDLHPSLVESYKLSPSGCNVVLKVPLRHKDIICQKSIFYHKSYTGDL